MSPGVAIGEALVVDPEGFRIPRRFVVRDAVEDELERLVAAMKPPVSRSKPTATPSPASWAPSTPQSSMRTCRCCAPRLRSEVDGMIRDRQYSPEYAVSRTLRRYAKIFQEVQSSHLAERATDIFDIEKRLLRNLLGREARGTVCNLSPPVARARA